MPRSFVRMTGPENAALHDEASDAERRRDDDGEADVIADQLAGLVGNVSSPRIRR